MGTPADGECVTSTATTTSRKKTKTNAKVNGNAKRRPLVIGPGKRCKMKRMHIYPLLAVNTPARELVDSLDSREYNLYVTAVSKQSHRLWKVKLDMLPMNDYVVLTSREHITMVFPDDHVPKFDREQKDADDIAEKCATAKRMTPSQYAKESIDSFVSMDKAAMKTTKSFISCYGPKASDTIEWIILGDEQEINACAMKEYAKRKKQEAATDDNADSSAKPSIDKGEDIFPHPIKKDIPWDPDPSKVNYNSILFEHFLPSVVGKAKMIDEYLSDPRCGFHQTAVEHKIKFHCEGDKDPDKLVKLCITLLIAASKNEHITGVDNLWKSGPSAGLRDHADWGQYIPKNYSKAFQCDFCFLWADKKYWYHNPRELPWDLILPYIDEYNGLRNDLLEVNRLLLDETMSGFRPKTTKTGDLQHITFEKRKPVELGTMAKNGADAITGIFAHRDMVQDLISQRSKKYLQTDNVSNLPNREPILQHVAECLRQAEGAKLQPGGWMDGDAWFGSIPTVVELFKRLDVFSSFIVKNNTQYFPKYVIYEILLARFGDRPAGHWVVMHANISGVAIMIMAYAWSMKGISYIVSSCGKTIHHEKNYVMKYAAEYGQVCEKEIPCPTMAHILFDLLPSIDEHNKQLQSVLALETTWLTKSGFTRNLVTFTGMSCVDIQRWDRSMRCAYHLSTDYEEGEGDYDIKEMVNFICRPLKTGKLNYDRKVPRQGVRENGDYGNLTRIRGGEDNLITNEKGRSRNGNCFVCRIYNKKYKVTNWMCRGCGMPICKVNHNHLQACFEEHSGSSNEHIGCRLLKRTKGQFILRDDLKETNHPFSAETIQEAEEVRVILLLVMDDVGVLC